MWNENIAHSFFYHEEGDGLYNQNLVTEYVFLKGEGKSVPLKARRVPEGSRKLTFIDFVTKAQDGGRLSALSTGRLCPQKKKLLVLISVKD